MRGVDSGRANRENRGSPRVAGQTGVSCEVTPAPPTPYAPRPWSNAAACPVPRGPAAGAVAVGVQWRGCEAAAAAAGSRAHPCPGGGPSFPFPGGLVWRP